MSSSDKLQLVLQEITAHLQEVTRTLKRAEVARFIREIENAKRIFIYGAGRSGYVARAFAQRMEQIGFDAYFVGETITPSAKKGDLLIIVSGSGQTPSVLAMVKTGKTLGLREVAVTSNRLGGTSKAADAILYVPGKTKLLERKTHAPFTSLFDIATLSVLDGVTAKLMQRRGLDDRHIGMTHANLE